MIPNRTSRLRQLREAMRRDDLDALLLSDRRNIFYYCGFTGDDSYLLVTQEQLFLLSDGRFIAQAAAEAPDAQMLCRRSGETTGGLLVKALQDFPGFRRLGFEGGNLRYAGWAGFRDLLQKRLPYLCFKDCGTLPLQPRLIKDDYETDCLRTCGQMADKALEEILPKIKAGVSEREIAWQLEQALHNAGADGVSFATIAAGGINSAKPHAVPSDYRLQQGDFLTLDFGALYRGYCGDCTRTFAIGRPSAEMAAAYRTVLAAQEQALAQIKPGITCGEADDYARRVIEDAGLGEYFSHSLGHGTGLNIHEAPTLAPNNRTPLAPGQVVTVEPGVYLPGKFGLRIEDSCLITPDGAEPLTVFSKELICL